ncbi:MAG: hypothetical protein AN484_27525, partial [Aphanizomenon flos-aquae WA102]
EPAAKPPLPCPIEGCKHQQEHPMASCWKFLTMGWPRRMKAVLDYEMCGVCLNKAHRDGSVCAYKDSPCKNKCREKHHTTLCWKDLCEERSPRPPTPEARASPSRDRTPNKKGKKSPAHKRVKVKVTGSGEAVKLLTQTIEVAGGHNCLALWDTGSQATLVTHQFARRAGLQTTETGGLTLVGLGDGFEEDSQVAYIVPLLTSSGEVREVTAHGLDYITSPVERVEMPDARSHFKQL